MPPTAPQNALPPSPPPGNNLAPPPPFCCSPLRLTRCTQMEADGRIRDVWADNMNEEFACIRRVARAFPYVAMDTEFPGVVAKPTGTFRTNSDYQ